MRRLVVRYGVPPAATTWLIDASRRRVTVSSNTKGPVGPPIMKPISGRGRSASLGSQAFAAAATAVSSTRIRGRVTCKTLGSGAIWVSAPTMIRSKRLVQPEGLVTRTTLVRQPDCLAIHSDAIEGRRPTVMIRSGQGGSSGSECARSR